MVRTGRMTVVRWALRAVVRTGHVTTITWAPNLESPLSTTGSLGSLWGTEGDFSVLHDPGLSVRMLL